jgi:hypothetical protein
MGPLAEPPRERIDLRAVGPRFLGPGFTGPRAIPWNVFRRIHIGPRRTWSVYRGHAHRIALPPHGARVIARRGSFRLAPRYSAILRSRNGLRGRDAWDRRLPLERRNVEPCVVRSWSETREEERFTSLRLTSASLFVTRAACAGFADITPSGLFDPRRWKKPASDTSASPRLRGAWSLSPSPS